MACRVSHPPWRQELAVSMPAMMQQHFAYDSFNKTLSWAEAWDSSIWRVLLRVSVWQDLWVLRVSTLMLRVLSDVMTRPMRCSHPWWATMAPAGYLLPHDQHCHPNKSSKCWPWHHRQQRRLHIRAKWMNGASACWFAAHMDICVFASPVVKSVCRVWTGQNKTRMRMGVSVRWLPWQFFNSKDFHGCVFFQILYANDLYQYCTQLYDGLYVWLSFTT